MNRSGTQSHGSWSGPQLNRSGIPSLCPRLTSLSRRLIKYTGGKFRFRKTLVPVVYGTHSVYVEPFCGGCGLFFSKPPHGNEVLNDLDGDIYNLLMILKDKTLHLELMERLKLLPVSRQLYDEALAKQKLLAKWTGLKTS